MKTLATGLLVLLSLLVAENSIAQQSINAPPDTIFYNGKIITVDSGFTIAQAFAVRGDLYVAVGTDAAIRALAGANTRLVDLRGFAIIPGLSDNHDHLYNSEKVMRGIDLVGATSTAEVLRRLRDGLAKAKAGEAVFGGVGWRAPLTRNDLDQVSSDVPVVALRGRRGAAVMNSAALKKAGIVKEMQSYMGKEIPKDSGGELTGELPDFPAGLYAIDRVLPLPTPDQEDQMIAAGQKQRNALGITSTRDLSNWPPGMRAFVRMWRQGRLTVRVSMGLELPDASNPVGLVREQGVTPGFGDHWLRIDSAGEQPNPPGGNATPEQYKALMLELNRLGWRHSPHVGTNEALEAVLQAYEAADRESPIRDKRWVVEHIPNVTPPLMDRLAKLGVIVSTNMAGYAGNYDAAVRALGQEQAQRQTPVREKKRPVTANRKHTMGYDAIRRRTFLTGAGVAAVVTGLRPPEAFAQEGVPNSSRTEMQRRIGDVIHSYEEQGFHRTGTAVDQISGDWLIGQVREIGLEPTREEWSLSRVDPIDASLIANGRQVEGLPLFDGGFTASAGVHGRPPGAGADMRSSNSR